MDYNQVISQALNPVAGQLQTPPPPLTTGQPLVPDSSLRDALSGAMQQPQPTADDKNTALLKIGTALLRPRRPGESVAGNVGKAVDEGSNYIDEAKKRQMDLKFAQANLTNATATSDAQRRVIDQNMQLMAAKYPQEYALVQAKLRQATLEGKAAEVDAIKAHLAMGGAGVDYLAKQFSTAQAQSEANVGKTNAEAGKATAEAIAAPAHAAEANSRAAYLDRQDPNLKNVRQQMSTQDLGEGRSLHTYMYNGKQFYDIVNPGIPDSEVASKLALKQLNSERKLRGQSNGWLGLGGPTNDEIAKRTKELQTPSTISLDHNMKPLDKSPENESPSPARQSPQSSMGTESPEQRRQAAQGSLDKLNEELKNATDPIDKARLQASIKRLEIVANSENPHDAGRAVRPETVSKPLQTSQSGDNNFVRDNNGRIVPAKPQKVSYEPPVPTEDLLPHERGRSQEQKKIESVKPIISAKESTVEDVRTVLKKTKPDTNDLLLMESYKDSNDLTTIERAKIEAALKRAKLNKQ